MSGFSNPRPTSHARGFQTRPTRDSPRSTPPPPMDACVPHCTTLLDLSPTRDARDSSPNARSTPHAVLLLLSRRRPPGRRPQGARHRPSGAGRQAAWARVVRGCGGIERVFSVEATPNPYWALPHPQSAAAGAGSQSPTPRRR